MSPAGFVPELVVFGSALALLLAARLGGEAAGRRWGRTALLAALVALGLELWLGAATGSALDGGWQQDRFSLFAKAALLLGLVALLAARWDTRTGGPALARAFVTVGGGMVVASAGWLVGIWVGLALAAGAGLSAAPDRPGSLPRPIAGAGLALAGLSFAGLSATGAGSLTGLHRALAARPDGLGLGLAVGAALAGITVLWIGAARSGPAGGLAGGVATVAAAKLLAGLTGASPVWEAWLAVLAAAGLVAGGLGALSAGGPARLAGWLAVGQLGWVAAGLATHDQRGSAAALFLLGALLVAGAASVLTGAPAASSESLAGLAGREPGRAAGLTLALLSLAGAPPLAGFVGEFAVAAELLRSGLAWVLALGVGGWLLALAGVSRLLLVVYLRGGVEEARRGARARAPVWALGAVVPGLLAIAYVVFANPVHGLAVQGAAALGLR